MDSKEDKWEWLYKFLGLTPPVGSQLDERDSFFKTLEDKLMLILSKKFLTVPRTPDFDSNEINLLDLDNLIKRYLFKQKIIENETDPLNLNKIDEEVTKEFERSAKEKMQQINGYFNETGIPVISKNDFTQALTLRSLITMENVAIKDFRVVFFEEMKYVAKIRKVDLPGITFTNNFAPDLDLIRGYIDLIRDKTKEREWKLHQIYESLKKSQNFPQPQKVLSYSFVYFHFFHFSFFFIFKKNPPLSL